MKFDKHFKLINVVIKSATSNNNLIKHVQKKCAKKPLRFSLIKKQIVIMRIFFLVVSRKSCKKLNNVANTYYQRQ